MAILFSKEELEKVFRLEGSDAQIITECCSLDRGLLEKWAEWASAKPSFDSDSANSDLRYRYNKVDLALDIADFILGTHGVEAITDGKIYNGSYYLSVGALYCNKGDTYDATILYDVEEEDFLLCSWGDWYEGFLAEQEEEEEE